MSKRSLTPEDLPYWHRFIQSAWRMENRTWLKDRWEQFTTLAIWKFAEIHICCPGEKCLEEWKQSSRRIAALAAVLDGQDPDLAGLDDRQVRIVVVEHL